MAIHHECRNQHDAAGCRKTQTLCPLPVNVNPISVVNRGYTHPMREDVKKKYFSTPLRGIPEW